MPRVNGNSPGVSPPASAGTSPGPYTRLTGTPQDASGSRSLIGRSSQRNVAVLARRVRVALRFQDGQRGAESRACVAGLDHLVHVTALGGDVGIGELLAVLANPRLAESGIGGRLQFALVQNIDGA